MRRIRVTSALVRDPDGPAAEGCGWDGMLVPVVLSFSSSHDQRGTYPPPRGFFYLFVFFKWISQRPKAPRFPRAAPHPSRLVRWPPSPVFGKVTPPPLPGRACTCELVRQMLLYTYKRYTIILNIIYAPIIGGHVLLIRG